LTQNFGFSKSAEGCGPTMSQVKKKRLVVQAVTLWEFFSMEGARFLVDENDRIVSK